MPMFRRRSVRLRFTALYGVVFMLSGAGLLAIANLVTLGSIRVSHTAPAGTQRTAPDQAQAHIAQLQAQLAEQHTTQTRQLLMGSLIALGVMMVASAVLGRLVAGRVLRPLRTMTAATRRISADNLHERLAVPGPSDEVKDLADTIDELLERLEGAFAAQRRFVANASHELRTPLTTMRASLDVAVAKAEPAPPATAALVSRLRTELDQVDRLLESFLALARTQHGDLPDRTTVSLEDLASTALTDRAADVAALGLTVRKELDPVRVRGSTTLLRRMVDNVVDNAIRHNVENGWIRVATSAVGTRAVGTGAVGTSAAGTGAAGTGVRLVVETGGEVLDHGQVAELAQPFRRLGADRTGSGAGLGLSIVAAIVAAHGGSLDLWARPSGGLRVLITLPGDPA
jgi:signal transduction histidine kinase